MSIAIIARALLRTKLAIDIKLPLAPGTQLPRTNLLPEAPWNYSAGEAGAAPETWFIVLVSLGYV
ncbi:hypothetical protein ACX40Y_16390 [Sphingomonas sp. RS6]